MDMDNPRTAVHKLLMADLCAVNTPWATDSIGDIVFVKFEKDEQHAYPLDRQIIERLAWPNQGYLADAQSVRLYFGTLMGRLHDNYQQSSNILSTATHCMRSHIIGAFLYTGACCTFRSTAVKAGLKDSRLYASSCMTGLSLSSAATRCMGNSTASSISMASWPSDLPQLQTYSYPS